MRHFLSNLNLNSESGIVHKIRPKVILKELENNFDEPVEMRLNVPSSEIGSLTTLEATMLISILNLINPLYIFEFGTFLGYSTSIFLKNSAKDCKTYSIDLGSEFSIENANGYLGSDSILKNDEVNDNYLRIMQAKKGPFYIQKDILENNSKLQLLYGDSTRISLENFDLIDKVNLVFIDGGHTYDIVKSDTENAFKMIKKGVIIWHDYNSQLHSDVTKFVDELSFKKNIFHIENTMLAFCII